MSYARIIGTGGYLPERVVTNHDLAEMVETSHEWIVERTGIEQRHVLAEHESSATMATEAAKRAVEAAGIAANDLDLIIVATCTPEKFLPNNACVVQHELGISRAIPAFDVSAACAGFIYGLNIANQFIQSGSVKNALVIGSEAMSRIIDWQDRSTCILFGDGAGAVVLQQSEQPGILSTHLHAQGKYGDLLYVTNPAADGTNGESAPNVQMRGNEVFKLAVQSLNSAVEEALEANQLDKTAIDWLVPHQANSRIIAATARKLKLPLERVILTVAEHGNTSAASVPLALDVGIRDGRIQRDELLLLEAFGGGMAWGSALIRY